MSIWVWVRPTLSMQDIFPLIDFQDNKIPVDAPKIYTFRKPVPDNVGCILRESQYTVSDI